MLVRKDGSAAKPSRRSDEYAFQTYPPLYCLTIQPHPPLTRSPFPDLGEGFKLNRSSRLQTEETLKLSLPPRGRWRRRRRRGLRTNASHNPNGYKPKSRLNQAFPKEGKVVVVPVRKDGSAAKPSRRSDEYAFQPHPPLTRSPFPVLGEGFKLNRSSRLQNEETV